MNSGAIVDVTLGAPSSPPLFQVAGNLTLGGTLNVAAAAGYGFGVYSLFDYGGILTNNGMSVAALPAGDVGVIQTSVANQVNLVVSAYVAPTI